MELRTVLLIILSAVAAIIIVFYQYFYKNPRKGSLKIGLAFLRFLAIFCALLLLVNPKFVSNAYFLEKTNLILLVDDSNSIQEMGVENEVISAAEKLQTNIDLRSRFNIFRYAFGERLVEIDSLGFDKKNTDIHKTLSTIGEVFINSSNAMVLLSDGIQTLGRDYEYFTPNQNSSIHSVVVGDTTTYQDISVGLLNSNRYAFLNNRFPVETTIVYNGNESVSRNVTVTVNGARVHQERLNLSPTNTIHSLNVQVEAKTVGFKTIRVAVDALENERNRYNNVKETVIEVIDEKTNVLLVSDMLHPDIGALKKAIESNEQRSMQVVKPNVSSNTLEEADVLILFQPNRSFKPVYDFIANAEIGHLTVAGSHTDWDFLNDAQKDFTFEDTGQTEEISPRLNNSFGLFNISDLDTHNFPPLIGSLGELEFFKEAHDIIMWQNIRGVDLNTPLFAISNKDAARSAVLFGENIWKWRAQAFRNNQDFEKFDEFIGKLVRFLSDTKRKSRLDLDFNPVFENAQNAKIRATYFDESYEFDPNASLKITMKVTEGNFSRESPMILKGNYYQTDLSDLQAGEYSFTVTVENENLNRSGQFKIQDFNPEKQMLAADIDKLERLASRTDGMAVMSTNLDSLITELATSDRYRPVQKSRQNVVSLIDFRILLAVIVFVLALEWFLRKYNGLI